MIVDYIDADRDRFGVEPREVVAARWSEILDGYLSRHGIPAGVQGGRCPLEVGLLLRRPRRRRCSP